MVHSRSSKMGVRYRGKILFFQFFFSTAIKTSVETLPTPKLKDTSKKKSEQLSYKGYIFDL